MRDTRFTSLVKRAARLSATAGKASRGKDEFSIIRRAIRRQIAAAVRAYREGEQDSACDLLRAYGEVSP